MEPSPFDAVFAIPELLAHILGFLELGDVPAARRTCRAWNATKFRVQCGPADHERVKKRVLQLVIKDAGFELKVTLAQVDLDAATATHVEHNMLAIAAGHGRLAIAQWLADHFGSTAGVARMVDNWALRTACERGYLETAQWLTSHFRLTPEDARADDNYALREACANGHLRTAQWLADHFELTTAEVQSSGALSRACANDDLDTVRWLAGRFKFTAADILHAVYWTNYTKGISANLETVRWLASRPSNQLLNDRFR